MKFWLEHVFDASWEDTTKAFWNKYPNEKLPHVLDALVVSRYIDKYGHLRTVRIMCVEQNVPLALRAVTSGLSKYFALEETVVDPVSRRLSLRTQNISFSKAVTAIERGEYIPDPANPENQTSYSMELTCSVGVPLFRNRAEHALGDQAIRNAAGGLGVMNELCDIIVSQSQCKSQNQEHENPHTDLSSSTSETISTNTNDMFADIAKEASWLSSKASDYISSIWENGKSTKDEIVFDISHTISSGIQKNDSENTSFQSQTSSDISNSRKWPIWRRKVALANIVEGFNAGKKNTIYGSDDDEPILPVSTFNFPEEANMFSKLDFIFPPKLDKRKLAIHAAGKVWKNSLPVRCDSSSPTYSNSSSSSMSSSSQEAQTQPQSEASLQSSSSQYSQSPMSLDQQP